MPTVPTRAHPAGVLPPDAVPLVLGALDQALGLLQSAQEIVDAYSQLYATHVEPHFPDGEDCPEGRQIERASGIGLIGDLLAEAAEVITTRMGGTGSPGLTIDEYRAMVADAVTRNERATAIERLRHEDPDSYDRLVAAAAILDGTPVPCPACDVVATDSDAWLAHAEAEHLGAAS